MGLLLVGCDSEVTRRSQGAGGDGATSTGGAGAQGGSGAGGGTATSTQSCSEDRPLCADFCGSDYFPEEAVCEGGVWHCPPPPIDTKDCPEGTCWGPPLECEVCTDDGWACELVIDCVVSTGGPGELSVCNALPCAICDGAPSSTIVGGCACSCDDVGQVGCQMAPGCCNVAEDCGDFVYAPCVNNVCKNAAPPGKCWSNEDCLAMGMVCATSAVCPCGETCPQQDQLGDCVPI